MTDNDDKTPRSYDAMTELTHLGRSPEDQHGFVNPPIYRGSTVLFPTAQNLLKNDQEFTYGRRGTPQVRAFERALAHLEGGADAVLTPSGLSAISCALTAFTKQGGHILVADSVYYPTRVVCERQLSRFGVQTTYYDPTIGANIANLIRPNTTLIYTESPGSLSFEVQDIPAITTVAHQHGIPVLMDNTWATPLYFKPFAHGVDVSIHSGTKYITGHADAMLGAIITSEHFKAHVRQAHGDMGLCAGSEEANLGLRGLRTLSVRLAQHQASARTLAQWLRTRPEVARVIYPALEDDAGHRIWQRDFAGASGLFAIILHPVPETAVHAMLNGLRLFGMGWSWGGYESLAIPFDLTAVRTEPRWQAEGPALRFHIGLEDPQDLIDDLSNGFRRLTEDG